jgi:GTP cyclohydrolase I
MKEHVKQILEVLGEDSKRDGLVETPDRVERSLKELTTGYAQDPEQILSKTFDVSYDEVVLLRNIDFTSTCEHHLLPFIGIAHVAYIPSGRVVGISKLARLVQCFALRLQVQERMTMQIADAIEEFLKPKAIAVLIIARHQCMSCRGVRSPNAEMITSVMRGAFLSNPSARAELLQLVTLKQAL